MFPRIVIDKKKLFQNTQIIVGLAKAQGIDVFVVTKVQDRKSVV